MALGGFIKSRRVEIGLTQIQLANKACISQAAINLYENDKRVPTSTNIVKLAEALETSPDYLLRNWRIMSECACTKEIDTFALISKLIALDKDQLKFVNQIIESLTANKSISV
jgi:transcriptional regulator with XRE-family HTH domain